MNPTTALNRVTDLFKKIPETDDEFMARMLEQDKELEGYVVSMEDLPQEGDPDITYHVYEDKSIWRWSDGAYREVNKYVYGVDEQYIDRRVYSPKYEIIDSSSELASISLDQVRSGGSPTLAVYYNLIALRADLAMHERLVVDDKSSVMDLLGKGQNTDPERNVTEWFRREHSALNSLLCSSARAKDNMYNPVVDVLHLNEASLVWDDSKNRPVFKINNFKVYL